MIGRETTIAISVVDGIVERTPTPCIVVTLRVIHAAISVTLHVEIIVITHSGRLYRR